MAEQAIFTAIPAGRVADGLKVTVFITPKLVPPPGSPAAGVPLQEFEAFANWPRTVEHARFLFDLDGVGVLEGFGLTNPIVPDPALWDILFGRTMVGAAAFQDYSAATVHSYPVAEVAARLTQLYQDVAVNYPKTFPPVTTGPLAAAAAELSIPDSLKDPSRHDGPRRARIRAGLATHRLASEPAGRYLNIDAVPLAQQTQVAFAAASAFYDRSDDPLDPVVSTTGAPKPVPPEFHSFVSRCAEYPELLRRLGLAFDVFIKDDPGYPDFSTIRVLPDENDGLIRALLDEEEARPFTFVRHTDRVWAPASREDQEDVRDGSLSIERDDAFTIEQLDPDGSVLKLSNLLDTVRRTAADLVDPPRSMTADAASLPALRSTGILISRRNRAQGLVGQFDRAKEHEKDRGTHSPARLGVMDVTRGWRIDIQDASIGADWKSLHRREGSYEIVDPGGQASALPVQPKPDEGHLKAASTSSTKPGTAADQYLHESVGGWDGWSLAVKRPGRLQREDDTVPANEAPEVADTGFPLAVEFRPARGSLPRLRFGRQYRVRVRAVDLSGGSIPDEQLLEDHERDVAEPYQRWEPVPSPAIVPLTEFTEGESLVRLVIRSTDGMPVEDYVAQPRVTGLNGHSPDAVWYRADNARHLAAPASSVQLAEAHGVFDAALDGNPAAVAAQFAIAARESGSFLLLPGGRVVNATHPEQASVLLGLKTQLLNEGEYVVHDTQALPLPYLPDPLSRGLSFSTLPGDVDTRLLRWPGAADAWHDRLPVLVRAVEGTGEPTFDEAARTLTVFLPKAEFRTVRVSSFLDKPDLDILRIWNLIAQNGIPTPAQREAAEKGLHWMLTPFTELTFVHAVEKPLDKPAIRVGPGGPSGSRVARRVGSTYAALFGDIRNHAASTGRIDIDAVWVDPVDDVLAPAPDVESVFAHVAGFQIERGETDALIAETEGPAGGPVGPRHEVKHEFGDTRHRYVDYTATATTRFREYFPTVITDDPDLVTTVGDPLQLNIPSSRRPDPPDIRYIVPTWTWTTDEIGAGSFGVRRVRSGGGLRVYLGRPWYSSGPDELLGVVVRIQPWLTWPIDVTRGIDGSFEARALSDTWAKTVLEHAGTPVSDDAPASSQLLDSLTTPLRVASVTSRGRSDDEKILVKARQLVGQLRARDTVVDVSTVAGYLPLYFQTGPNGRPFTSVWGADPVFTSAPVAPGPYIHQFPLRTSIGSSIALAEVDERVTVIGHTPEFDPERRLWFCDLQLDAGNSYTPFVQLALARYQPHSVEKQHLSKVVTADFVQLLPRREATFVLSADARSMAVTMSGPVGIPQHAVSSPNTASRITASRLVQAWVEMLPADATTDLAWKQVGSTATLQLVLGLAALRNARYEDVEWAGAVSIPDRGVGERWRVRIAEYELHRSDRSPVGLIAPFRMRDERLVYSDTVELPD